MSEEQKKWSKAQNSLAHSKGREAMSEEQKKWSQAQDSLAHSKGREAMSEEQKILSQAQNSLARSKAREAMLEDKKMRLAHARQAAKGHTENISEKEFLEWTREDTEEKGTGPRQTSISPTSHRTS